MKGGKPQARGPAGSAAHIFILQRNTQFPGFGSLDHFLKIIDLLNPFQVQIMDSRSLIQIQDGMIPTHPLVFRKADKETIAIWINYAAIVQSTQQRTLVEYNTMMIEANEIIQALQKEYHLN